MKGRLKRCFRRPFIRFAILKAPYSFGSAISTLRFSDGHNSLAASRNFSSVSISANESASAGYRSRSIRRSSCASGFFRRPVSCSIKRRRKGASCCSVKVSGSAASVSSPSLSRIAALSGAAVKCSSLSTRLRAGFSTTSNFRLYMPAALSRSSVFNS